MKKFYISSKNGLSGISRYSRDFFQLILKEKDYIFIDSGESFATILSTISSKDHVHIEIAIERKKETEVLFLMLKANYKSVAVTLHDAPLLKYPFYEFKNSFLNKISRFYDKYIDGFRASSPYMKKIKSIYVLSEIGLNAVKKKYRVGNVYHLPPVLDSDRSVTEAKKKITD